MITASNNWFFLQNGAPPHYAAPIFHCQNNKFKGYWVDRREFVFLLWGHWKSAVYKTHPASLQDLQERITENCQGIAAYM